MATLRQVALVKMTQEEMDEIRDLVKVGLNPKYALDSYVYLINADGTDADFKGFYGGANLGVSAPYLVCPVHTQKGWDDYQESLKPTEPPTEPGDIPPAGGGGVSDDSAVG